MEVVSKWLASLFQSRVEAAYQKVRREYLPPTSGSAGVPEPQAPSSRSPPPTASSESDSPSLPGHLTGDPGICHRDKSPHADEPQQRSGRVNSSLGARPEGIDQPGRKRRRRRSSKRDGKCVDAGKQGRIHEQSLYR